ncbi:phosphoenolpyruvate carboxykinase (ATP) [Halobacterium noricense]|uniref:phosphoenolpyruvate carboxykinase (ATP) n=1 Tax=Halobacterium noricense TaxID=223182 RepID=UPI001E39FB01|nr:phosphoenolpyruvate carboxykinase (ATP) [Halobacterium noricense]UHH24027.1 phosphoenolpyruvate carboxykinase (ATP) [Halobacterium noricense]
MSATNETTGDEHCESPDGRDHRGRSKRNGISPTFVCLSEHCQGEEGNRFRDLIAELDVECYVINTGAVGTDNPAAVGVEETVAILEGVARDSIDWQHDDELGLTVPSNVPGIDAEQFSVPDRVDDFDAALREERLTYLDQFDDLDDDIVDATY